MKRLPPAATIAWIDGVPRAEDFGDFYYSRAGGLAEAEAVFLVGCGLPQAWAGRRCFTIVELGFGTGLNALATWRAWAAAREPGAILHFCSIEAAPLERADAARALGAFPDIEPFSRQLLEAWPVRARAPQRLWFEADGFALTLLVGEAASVLRDWPGAADCWFLDGFAPDRNPAMWSEELMRLLAARSAPGARLATYSVAGAVRRNLNAAGFAVEKKPGFAAKRERLEAKLSPPPPRGEGVGGGGPAGEPKSSPPSLRPDQEIFPHGACEGPIALVGGGIAGATLAHALTRRGRECVIVDSGAPSSPAALVMPQLDRGRGVHAEWRLAAWLAAASLYESLGVIDRCGAVEIARDPVALADFAADPPLPTDWLAVEEGRYLHPRAGIVRPAALIQALTRGIPRIAADIVRLERAGAGWRLFDRAGAPVAEASAVALCVGARLAQFEQTSWLPLRLSRGQLEWSPGPGPDIACVDEGYVAPGEGGFVFGATYDRAESPDAPVSDETSRRRNLATLKRLAPRLRLHGERMVSFAGLRAATPDYAPVVGLMPDAPAWRTQYAGLRHGQHVDSLTPPALPGLYVFGALSARGFTHAPLLAERLAAEMNGELPPLSAKALDCLHPARFLKRALKRNE